MFPDKHFEEIENSRKKRKNILNLTLVVSFTLSFFLLGPYIHELSHIAWLEFNDCFYQFRSGFTFLTGFHGKVTPVCYLDKSQLVTFYSIGYLSTIVGGGILNLGSTLVKSGRTSKFLSVTGNGLLASMLLSITSEGDISSLIHVLELPAFMENFATLFIVLGIFSTGLLSYQNFVSEGED